MIEYLFFALMLLQAADVYTTVRILGAGGVERSRALVWLMNEVGVLSALVMFKLLVLITFTVLLPLLPEWFIGAVIGWYVAIVVNNVMVLREQRHGP